MKKFLIASVAAVSLLGLAACNDKKDDTNNAPASTPAAPSNNDTTPAPTTPATPAPSTPGTGTAPSN
ncbi:hypothetical protein CN878_06055 [Ochrobactrum sp. 695/2009]|uniref:hypothetical protein n=1 Tax=Brucella intermedia TaxID=94625 RepID=UPI000C28A2F5|nr:hypothetical protein [Brucella intermedia]PJR94286.1 hypothetical protein CN881_01320 [Ochrobactrum sp. 721/2009]PJT17570.1 hypothetical protein CN880_02785 [Ochrobactrum sp. 720/2009]PJT21924.1 hypothetical protein CN879_11465 [Ochrobactrum sp. 715/2009]PJT30918.1 hypothetical protein CN878_06055 [Ochrobactrum sp. 695/2009]PJT32932.1 hypothetical protein CN877_15990 [Ochrobactrum sp. 689/2009]